MEVGDLDGVVAVARIAFPDHFESAACFAERFSLYPKGCFALDRGDGTVAGYLIAYPWNEGSAPPLDSLIGALPAAPDVLYLHDLALHPDARGKGFTRIIVEQLVAKAGEDGWPTIALVAVNDAVAFWHALGFAVKDEPGLAHKLTSYGADARYMQRQIAD